MVGIAARVKEIIEVALKIKEVVTVHQNKEDCKQTGQLADRVLALLSWIENTPLPMKSLSYQKNQMNSLLEKLEGTLRLTLELITDCKEENDIIMCLCFASGRNDVMSKELCRVNDDIVAQLGNSGWRLIHFFHQDSDANPAENFLRPAAPEDSGEMDNSSSCHSIDDTSNGRSQVKENVSARREDALISSGFTSFSLSELQTATNNFSDENVIGKRPRTRPTVYKGVLPGGLVVAIQKICWLDVRSHVDIFLVLLPHRNIVRFLGYCKESTEEYSLVEHFVEEYMPNGNLDDVLNGGRLWELGWPAIFRMIREIANGVAHLHTKNLVHLDLKPANILFDSDMNPVICDFKKCKILDQDVIETIITRILLHLNYDYTSPELLGGNIVSAKSDVYSFGVLLLYTIGGMRKPGLPEVPLQEWTLEVLEARGLNDLFDPSPSDESEIKRNLEIGLLCTQYNRRERPIMADVVDMLNGDKELPTPKRIKDAGSSEDVPVPPLGFTKFSLIEMEIATYYFEEYEFHRPTYDSPCGRRSSKFHASPSKEYLIVQGQIATFYKGLLPGGLVVAIKKFHHPWGPQSISQYVRVFSAPLQHENVIRFLGYCDEDGWEMVVEEYKPTTNLYFMIINGSYQQLDWSSRFRIIQGVANGLAYLHSKGIIHFDLTPANIAICGPDMNPKICDFGLSKLLDPNVSEIVTEGFEGTAGSMAPEYNMYGKISAKNDVYSFGDLIRTITGTSRCGPPQDLRDLARAVREAARTRKLFDPSLCDESELKQIKRCMDIGLLCTQHNPTDRPTMPDVVEMLNSKTKLPTPKCSKDSKKKDSA